MNFVLQKHGRRTFFILSLVNFLSHPSTLEKLSFVPGMIFIFYHVKFFLNLISIYFYLIYYLCKYWISSKILMSNRFYLPTFFTLCLDNNFGEERKEREWRGRKGRVRKGRKEKCKEVTLVCLGGKAKERKRYESFPSNMSNFRKTHTWTKIIHSIPLLQISSIPFCYPNTELLIPSIPSPFPSIFFHSNIPLVIFFCKYFMHLFRWICNT